MGKGLIALAVMAAAAGCAGFDSDWGAPRMAARRDPRKPQTRYRRNGMSPAQRLLERQRAKRAAK